MSKVSDDYNKSFFKNILIYVFLGFFSFMVADLVLLKFVRLKFFPTFNAKDAAGLKNLSPVNYNRGRSKNTDLAKYDKAYKHIINRNMFNSDGVISPPISSLQNSGEPLEEEEIYNDPVLSSLPLNLEGTIVHRNPYRSLATIENGGKATSYTVGDEIEGMAEIVSIIRKKVIIRNSDNKKLEYIEIPRDLKIVRRKPVVKVSKPSLQTPKVKGPSVVKREGNLFTAKRADVNKKLENMGQILREAKVERAVDPVTGEVMGFRFVNIKDNSILKELGFNVGDTITSVDGEPINSPNKAMMMYNKLKNASDIKIGIKDSSGQDKDFEYSVED